MASVLIVDDEPAINDLIAMNLQMVGYEYYQAYDGRQAVEAADRQKFDLVLLDVMLPELDGFEAVGLFQKKGIPVIFLTARDSLPDKVKGLRLGAEDYITKPFEALELLARMEVVLRRSGREDEEFCIGYVRVLLKEHTVYRENQIVDLTHQEFALLEMLVRNCNLALSRDKLLEGAWGYDYAGETRTVDMHIQRLRKKLDWDEVIKTVFKYGYRLEK